MMQETLRESAERHERNRPKIEAAIKEATPDHPLMDLSEIKGHEAVKRALEVAATGRHTLHLVGPPGSGKSMFVRAWRSLGRIFEETIIEHRPCPCGWLGDTTRECTCTPRMIAAHNRELAASAAAFPGLWAETPRSAWGELQSLNGETSEAVAQRILTAREVAKPTTLDASALALMKTAYERLGLGAGDYYLALSVAGTIAQLARSPDTIRAPHIAEAIQYRQPHLTSIRS